MKIKENKENKENYQTGSRKTKIKNSYATKEKYKESQFKPFCR